MLSCEICSYFEEHLWVSTYKLYLKRGSNIAASFEFCELFRMIYKRLILKHQWGVYLQ